MVGDRVSTQRKKGTAFRIVSDTYVTDDSGTGVVHQAPAFGEDDFRYGAGLNLEGVPHEDVTLMHGAASDCCGQAYRVCLHYGVISKDEPIVCPVDEVGNFTAEVPDFAKQNVKVPPTRPQPRRNAGRARVLR